MVVGASEKERYGRLVSTGFVDRSPPLGRVCVIAGTAITEDAYRQVSPFLDVNDGVISIVAFDGDHCVQVRQK